jgi:hypothetical protein
MSAKDNIKRALRDGGVLQSGLIGSGTTCKLSNLWLQMEKNREPCYR